MDGMPAITRTGLRLILAAAVLLALGAAYLLLSAPRLAAYAPQPADGPVSRRAPLRLEFSRPMQAESVQARLALEPAVPVAYIMEGGRLTVTPQQDWPAGATVTVTLQAGARAMGFISLPMLGGQRWSFQVGEPWLAYLWPAQGPADLYRLNPRSGGIERLTRVPGGVLDYTVSADGQALVYSSLGGQLYRLALGADRAPQGEPVLAVACPQAACRAPQLSPDGRWLAYVRTPSAAEEPGGYSQVWVQALPDGEARRVDESRTSAGQPAWSGTGWLSYYDGGRQAFIFWNPDSGERRPAANQTGEAGVWAPDGTRFIAPEILLIPYGYTSSGGSLEPIPASHLMAYGLRGGPPEDLTMDDTLEDTNPAISPDGRTLAFARKYLDPQRWTPGRQLWRMDLATGRARPLTEAPFFNHTAFAWSPDGARLAYVRANQADLSEPPELWLAGADGSEPTQLVIGGFDPQWIP